MSSTLQNDWVNWDDTGYVTENPLVKSKQIEFAKVFSTPEVMGLYHPLTIISLALDYQIWEENAFGFHLTNLILHLVNSILVFFLFRQLNSAHLIALIVAILFAIHPMHVESVAWISGRKDLLYVFFLLLSSLAYLRFLDSDSRRKIWWYSITLVAFLFSLLSKNIAFVFPLLLLLFDWKMEITITRKSLLVKIPFFALTIIAIFIAFGGQEATNSIAASSTYYFGQRLLFGSYNTVYYLVKCVAPVELAAFHPFPNSNGLSGIFYLAIFPFLLLITTLWWTFKKHRKVFFGLAFYLVAIAPLVQVVPFGKALSSERYTYLAYLGLFYLFALGFEKLRLKFTTYRPAIYGISILWILFIAIQTQSQTKVWKNSQTLWNQVIEVHPDSYWGYFSRGLYFKKQELRENAFEDFEKSISLAPSAEALYERGLMYEESNQLENAESDYRKSIRLLPSNAKAHLNLGIVLAKQQKLDSAIIQFRKAIICDSEYSLAHFNYATALKIKGDFKKSRYHYDRAILLEPKNAQYWEFRAALFANQGKLQKALKDFQVALKLNPKNAVVHFNMALLYEQLQKLEDANFYARKATSLGYKVPAEKNYLLE